MARYEHLPIYEQAMDVAVHFEKVVAGFSRYHKYTLGTELRNKSREIVTQIIRANADYDKVRPRNEVEAPCDAAREGSRRKTSKKKLAQRRRGAKEEHGSMFTVCASSSLRLCVFARDLFFLRRHARHGTV